MLENYLPAWSVGPSKLVLFTIGFYLLGKILVKPLVSWSVSKRSATAAGPVSKLALYITVILGVGVGLTAGGYGNVMTALGTVVAAGTVAIGFAMKDTLSALVSGFFILMDKPFEKGDWIEWNSRTGTVQEIGLRTTRVKTFDNELLTVPNSELANNTVKNPVAGKRLRVQIGIGIGYSDNIDTAKEIVQGVLENIEEISDRRKPDVKLVGLGASTVDLKARYWLEQPKRADFISTREKVLRAVKDSFDENGIDMPYPTTTIAGESITLEEE